MNRPRIVIAGTQSGSGKTSVSLALMAALTQAGRRVQAFKVGPDYIDPSYHGHATGRPSHNLDSWLLSPETVQSLFQAKSEDADISIIEGVMGLFDGFGSMEESSSTAQIAKLLKAPVILVLDAKGMARSAGAMVQGYQNFDPGLQLGGVVLNRVGSARHFEILKEAIEHYAGVPVLGGLMKDPEARIPERHLGLTTAGENENLSRCLERLCKLARPEAEPQCGLNLERILKIARSAPELTVIPAKAGRSLIMPEEAALPRGSSVGIQSVVARFIGPNAVAQPPGQSKIRIGIARDAAFSFYYQANLDLLSALGAELVPFSPLEDRRLPENLGALYFGGGFPEVHAQGLEENLELKSEIKKCIQSGMPVYAECGGLMYLSDAIETLDGKSYGMVGSIPGKIVMTPKLQNFGYKEGVAVKDVLLGSKGTRVRGHEFHYSRRVENDKSAHSYRLNDRKSGLQLAEGYARDLLLASYLHLHFLSDPEWAAAFVQSAGEFFSKKNLTPIS